jgi:hypothetical protein
MTITFFIKRLYVAISDDFSEVRLIRGQFFIFKTNV